MPTSPIPRLTADLAAAEDHMHRIYGALLDAERVRNECRSLLDQAVQAETMALLAEKAADRRRDAEADAADDRAELAEARTA